MKNIIICLFICLVLLACNNSSTESQQKFSVKVKVVDENNNPISGLDVRFENKIEWRSYLRTRSGTIIDFTVPTGHDSINIYVTDLANNVVQKLVNEKFCAGRHALTWYTRNDNGFKLESGVYKVFAERYSNNEYIETKSFEAYLIDYNGKTDVNGEYYTESAYPFLNFTSVDSIKIVREDGVIFPSKAVSDTTIVIVSKRYSYNEVTEIKKDIVVKKGKNEVTVVWKPEEEAKVKVKPVKIIESKDSNGGLDSDEFQFYQNYPNPFF